MTAPVAGARLPAADDDPRLATRRQRSGDDRQAPLAASRGAAARIAARIGDASSVCAGDTSSHSGARSVSASGPCVTARSPSPPYGSSAYPRPLRAAVATPDRCGASAVITASAPSWRIRPIASSRKLQGGS